MPDLPTGTVTFLFTDIEGSTKLWEQHPEAMRRALARHDALLQDAIEANSGHIFKTMGDQFCAAFTRAFDALTAALQAQRSLQIEPWGCMRGPRKSAAATTSARRSTEWPACWRPRTEDRCCSRRRREEGWSQRLAPADRRALTPLFYSHVNPYGFFRLNMEERLLLDEAA
jgi:Adenylate and Guanylate cyclase catalytic domain